MGCVTCSVSVSTSGSNYSPGVVCGERLGSRAAERQLLWSWECCETPTAFVTDEGGGFGFHWKIERDGSSFCPFPEELSLNFHVLAALPKVPVEMSAAVR